MDDSQISMDSSLTVTDAEREMENLKHFSYSTKFSEDINTRMRVPDKISMAGDEGTDIEVMARMSAANMQVPDRIIVGGSGTHVGVKDSSRGLDLDLFDSPLPDQPPVALTTPPRVITLEDHPFPAVNDQTDYNPLDETQRRSNAAHRRSMKYEPNGPVRQVPPSPSVNDQQYLTMDANEEDVIEEPVGEDLPALRYQVAKMSRRVLILETDNTQRVQREYIMYSVMLAFTVYKALKFVYKHW